jgi:hypothetical protein
MKLQKLAGATSEIWQVFIRDSSSTTGGGLTGLTNASSGLTAYYHRDTDTTATAIALVTMTVGTFTSSGFKEIDATNMPGWYQFCPPNAALASGAKSVGIHLKGATNMAPLPIEVQLLAVNVDDAVRMGITALPNANAEAAGGLFTRGTGAGQINQDANGRIDVNGKAWAGGAIPAPNVTGVPIVDDKYLLGTIYSTPATAGIQDINVLNWKGSAAAAMTGDAYARLGVPAGASVSADVAAVKAVLPAALVSGRIDASVGAYQTGQTPLQPATAGRTLVVDAAGLADANMVKIGPTGAGTAQTARDIGASVLLSAGTGTGQLDFTSGVVKANLAQILGTALTETAGQIAAGFKKFFNIATPAATMDHLVLVDTVTTYTGNTPQTGDAYARIGAAGAGLTALGDTRIAHLDADVSSRLASGSYTAPPSASTIAQAVWDVLTSALTTVGSIGKLLVTNIDAAISSRSAYAGGDTAGTTTLLSRLTSTRAGLLDHLDADISSRLAAGSYIAPDNSSITAIKAKTDNLPSDPADASDIAAAFTSLSGGISASFAALQSHGDGAWVTATGFSTLDASAVENAVWDATAASHVTSGSFGAEVNDMASAVGTIEGRIGTPAFGDLTGDIAHAQGVIDGINGVTSTLVMTAGKLWVLDESGNQLPHTSDISTIETAIGALPAATDNAAAVLAATYEGSETVQDHLRLSRAALYGKANGLAGSTVHFRDAADTKDRLLATVDADGNRSAVTTDAS